MNNLLIIVIGLIAIVVGMSLLINLTKIVKRLEIYNEQRKRRYENKFALAPRYLKVLGFLFFNQGFRYHSEKNTRYGLLFFSLLLVTWGVSMFLLGWGLIK